MIPLIVHETTGVDREKELIVGGAPVCRGALWRGGWFTLAREDGPEFVLEGQPAAYWPDGSVKWLHLCGLVDLRGGERNSFTLAPGAPAPEGALTVREDDGVVSVRGGVLDVDVRADASNVLAVRRAAAAPLDVLKAPGLSASLAYVGPDGRNPRTYSLSLADTRPEVVVRSANRVVVRLGGAFPGPDGTPVSELILFMEVYREVPEIRIEPVWIYLGRSRADLVQSLRLSIHVPLRADRCAYAFSDERGPGFWDEIQPVKNDERGGDGPRWPIARQVQLGSSFYRTEKLTFKQDASWVKCVEGRRSQGWCHVADSRLAVTAAMRYFWQEYPRSLQIDCDEGTLSFGLVPSEAAPLDLRRYSPLQYGPAVYESGPPGPFRWELHGAYGIAKASEVMLRLHSPGDADVAARALFFTRPCRFMPAPQHFARSRVIGQVAPFDAAGAPQVEGAIARIADFLIGERDRRGWYGLMDFGDVMSSFYSDRDRWAFDDGGYAWLNTESLPDYGLWISALRSGRADWLEAAIEMSRHNRDVDVYHRGELKGLGTRHSVNHWGDADKEWRVSMPLARRLHYYLTADPWTAECIRNTVAVYQSYERTTSVAPSMAAALAGILAKWEMSNDPADERAVRNLADAFARAVRPDGQFTAALHADLATGVGEPVGDKPHESTFFMNTFGGQHTLVELADLLEDAALADALTRHAAFHVEQGKAGVSVLPFLALAYRHTGDGRFLDAIRHALQRVTLPLEERGGDGLLDAPRHPVLAGLKRRNKYTCHGLGDPMHCVPYGLAVLGA